MTMDFTQSVQELRKTFATGRTRGIEWRISQLKAIIKLVQENEDAISEVLYKDLHKNKAEASIMEVIMCVNDAVNAINNIEQWTKPEKVDKNALYMMDTAYIIKEPLGVALIIGAWNYPVQLVLLPLIGAVTAGNCAVIKPSEVSPATAAFFEETLPKYLDNDCFRVINGGVGETTALLQQRFDIIFYTGNSQVAKIVMAAAAKNLTPVILELGGKSPVYVDKKTDLMTVARRLSWGKFCNSGQTCIAPDYVMCPKEIQEELIEKLKTSVQEFYTVDPKTSDSYGRIVNNRHFMRIQKLKEGATVAFGGDADEKENFISPTVLRDVKLTDAVMQDEIFGPLLPIVPVTDYTEAIDIINSREKPLALYVFTNNTNVSREFRDRTSSGALVVNDTVVHGGLPTLPFGGVGNSGLGSYHGKFSFNAFSHDKPVLEKSLAMDQVNSLRYPPYTDKKLGWIKWIMCKKPKRRGVFSFLPFVAIGVVLSFMFKVIGVGAIKQVEDSKNISSIIDSYFSSFEQLQISLLVEIDQ
ncbi:aldehyde dehydrogenase 3, member A2 [Bulinus truncatus]|nr:aldehyde dehydrogenase 3, member A2 [Bulinus truncatus]